MIVNEVEQRVVHGLPVAVGSVNAEVRALHRVANSYLNLPAVSDRGRESHALVLVSVRPAPVCDAS